MSHALLAATAPALKLPPALPPALPGATAAPVEPKPTPQGDATAGAQADSQADPKIWQAAQNFEAMAIGQLLAPMFDTVDVAHSLFGGGEAEATWRPMLVDAIGKQMQAHGGLGLAQPVYAAMLRAQEASGHRAGTGQPARRHTAYQPGRSA